MRAAMVAEHNSFPKQIFLFPFVTYCTFCFLALGDSDDSYVVAAKMITLNGRELKHVLLYQMLFSVRY